MKAKTPGNLTAELMIDVGTWSNLVPAIFRVLGLATAQDSKRLSFFPSAAAQR
jgi:hypothetical protein